VLIRGVVGRLTGPFVDQPDIHSEIGPLHVSKRIDCRWRYYNAEFFPELPSERLWRLLVIFEMSSRQVPGVGVPVALR
jgi:hypothetical protein